MAITPEQTKNLAPEEEAWVRDAEKIIDSKLQREYIGATIICEVLLPKSLRRFSVERLKNLYMVAGWDVSYSIFECDKTHDKIRVVLSEPSETR